MPPQEDATASQGGGPVAAAAAAGSSITVGCRVRIDGLVSKPELNGMEGVVTAQKEARWVVQPSGEGLAPLALKEANLTVVVVGSPEQTQEVRSVCSLFLILLFLSLSSSLPPSPLFLFFTKYTRME